MAIRVFVTNVQLVLRELIKKDVRCVENMVILSNCSSELCIHSSSAESKIHDKMSHWPQKELNVCVSSFFSILYRLVAILDYRVTY